MEGETGVFYERNDPEALAEVVSRLRSAGASIRRSACAAAQRFGVARFQDRLRAIVDEATRPTSARRAPASARGCGRSAAPPSRPRACGRSVTQRSVQIVARDRDGAHSGAFSVDY